MRRSPCVPGTVSCARPRGSELGEQGPCPVGHVNHLPVRNPRQEVVKQCEGRPGVVEKRLGMVRAWLVALGVAVKASRRWGRVIRKAASGRVELGGSRAQTEGEASVGTGGDAGGTQTGPTAVRREQGAHGRDWGSPDTKATVLAQDRSPW